MAATACDGQPTTADAGPSLPLCDNVPTDTQNDPNHCGYCTWQCLRGERCVGGKCECAPGHTRCFDACEDYRSAPKHCGRCGDPCKDGQLCTGGVCCDSADPSTCCPVRCKKDEHCSNLVCCPVGQVNCGGACVTLASDPDHCGACGAACPNDHRCAAG